MESALLFERDAVEEVDDWSECFPRLGRSSVCYSIAIFRQGADLAAAQGRFVHVYVDRATQRPVDIPDAVRAKLDALTVS